MALVTGVIISLNSRRYIYLNTFGTVRFRHFEEFEERIPRDEMLQLRQYVLSCINDLSKDYTAEVCGSFRRG